MNKILEMFLSKSGINYIGETVSFVVKWKCDPDGKVRITTPFLPGRQPSNYGNQIGIQRGDTGQCTISLEHCSDPSQVGFEQEVAK